MKRSSRRLRWLGVALGAAAFTSSLSAPGVAADKVSCTSTPFEAEVIDSRLDDEQTPTTMLARVRGMTTFTCSDGAEIPVALEQSFGMQFGNGLGDVCFKASDLDLSTIGQVRGRTQATLAARRPDGTTRHLNLRGTVDGTIAVNETDTTQCLLDLDATAHAANGGTLSIGFSGVIDRTTETLVSGISQRERRTPTRSQNERRP